MDDAPLPQDAPDDVSDTTASEASRRSAVDAAGMQGGPTPPTLPLIHPAGETLLEYEPDRTGSRPSRSLRWRLVLSGLIGVVGGAVNLMFLVLAIRRDMIPPFLLVNGPCTLGVYLIDKVLRLRWYSNKETVWVFLVAGSLVEYWVYGLLLTLKFRWRSPALVLALIVHLVSGTFLWAINFR
jgi:hypothetical protein